MIIDSHVHIGNWNNEDSVDEIISSASLNNINIIMVSALGERGYIAYPTVEEFKSANSLVMKAIERFPDKIFGICYVNPHYPKESIYELDRCIAQGPMVGIKLWVSAKASNLDLIYPIARKAIELDVPILQHAWYKTTGNMDDESSPSDVAILAHEFPDLKIQMAHLYGAGFRGIADISQYPNIYVDTGGGEPEAWILEYAVKELGPDRIVFGSDAPGRGFAVQIGKITGADISEETKEMILWKNVKRLYKLKI